MSTPHQDAWVLPDPEGIAEHQDVDPSDASPDDASDDSEDQVDEQVEGAVEVQAQVEPGD